MMLHRMSVEGRKAGVRCLGFRVWCSIFKVQGQREMADTDFGQTDFGHPYWPTLAKPTLAILNSPTVAKSWVADFGQNWCFSLLAFFFKKKEQQDEKTKHGRTNT